MLNLVFPVIGCSDGDAGQRVQDTVAGSGFWRYRLCSAWNCSTVERMSCCDHTCLSKRTRQSLNHLTISSS